MTPGELFSAGRYRELAELIDARDFDPTTARMLTVCNPDSTCFSGVVVFPVSMKWDAQKPLPPLRISDAHSGTDSSHRVDGMLWAEGRIEFTLVFSVESVPAHGYKSYIAEYVSVSGPALPVDLVPSILPVVETVPQHGTLPLTLSFG